MGCHPAEAFSWCRGPGQEEYQLTMSRKGAKHKCQSPQVSLSDSGSSGTHSKVPLHHCLLGFLGCLIHLGLPSTMRSTWASQVVLVVKSVPAGKGDMRDSVSIPASGRSPGGGHGNPLQYSCLENPMDKEALQATVHGVTKSQTELKRLSMHTPMRFTYLSC